MDKEKQKTVKHNFDVLLRYVSPIILTIGTLSFCLRYLFHLDDASTVTAKIAFGTMLLFMSKIVLEFLPAHVKLPRKPIGANEMVLYLSIMTLTLLTVNVFRILIQLN